jgi:hypothetical protein
MKKINFMKITLALLGILFIGIGVAFNVANQLGNDSIGLIYDGMMKALGLSTASLGMVSNLINVSLIVLLLIVGRRYINIGTLIYILPYGLFVNFGSQLYRTLAIDSMSGRIMIGVVGCLLIYLGVAIFIAVDIGLDPFTGVVMVAKDIFHADFRKVKIIFDLTLIAIGTLLGGKIGAVTILTALTAGPAIQWLSAKMQSFGKLNTPEVEEYCN